MNAQSDRKRCSKCGRALAVEPPGTVRPEFMTLCGPCRADSLSMITYHDFKAVWRDNLESWIAKVPEYHEESTE